MHDRNGNQELIEEMLKWRLSLIFIWVESRHTIERDVSLKFKISNGVEKTREKPKREREKREWEKIFNRVS
jgi:hypothetical protein